MEYMSIDQLWGAQQPQEPPLNLLQQWQQRPSNQFFKGTILPMLKNIGLTATSIPRVTASMLALSADPFLNPEIFADPERQEQLTRLLTPGERAKLIGPGAGPESIAEQTARSIAGSASFAVPGGGSLPGMIGRGALAGGLYTAGQEETTPGEIATGAAMGGTIAGGLGLGGRVLEKIRGIGGAGERIRGGVIQPQAPRTSPSWALREQELTQAAGTEGLKGSARQMAEQLPGKLSDLSSKIRSMFETNNPMLDGAEVQQTLGRTLESKLRFDRDALAAVGGEKGVLNEINVLGKNFKVSDLFKFKQQLGDSLRKAFDREAAGLIPLKPHENAGIELYRALNDVIASAVPEVREWTLRQSKLMDLAPGLYKSAHGPTAFGRLPAIGDIPGVREAGQRFTDTAGRTMIDLGEWGGRMGELANPLRDTFNTLVDKLPNEVRSRLLNWFSMTMSGRMISPTAREPQLPPILGGPGGQ